MRKDEGHGRFKREQSLLVLHDQVVGDLILSGLARKRIENFNNSALSPLLCKIGRLDALRVHMSPGRVSRLSVVERLNKESSDDSIFFGVVVHAIDKEKGENLDSYIVELCLFSEVLLNRVADLRLKKSLFVRPL